ncbi:MAG: alpha/beta fold hydrolase [Alphaproteobacteria bacterium]|nr:alpha/beta fold hydrolase [Alphaproteobacteria bacterium]
MPQAQVGPLTLEYERLGEGEPLLLIMGLGAQLLHWPDGFFQALAAEGFDVVRFDNRDIGLSTRLSHLPVPPLKRTALAGVLGYRRPAPYSLSDMAADSVGLMDQLGWERAHVVGVSMGGMIAQRVALHHRERVRTLTSWMSTTGNPRVGRPTLKAIRALLSPTPQSAEEYVAMVKASSAVIGTPGRVETEDYWRSLGTRLYARGPHPQGFIRQLAAVVADGDRTPLLRRLDLPTLVMHGSADPLIPISGGQATAAAIPGARFEVFEGYGHDIPTDTHGRFARMIANHARGV